MTNVYQAAMKSFFQGEPRVVIHCAPGLLIVGILWFFASALVDGHGIITALFAVSLGAAGASLERWQSERGLWMLAGLYFVIWVVIYS